VAVVLKVQKVEGDEWFAGEVFEAFVGKGMAHCIAHEPGAVLIERLNPGAQLVSVSDSQASHIIAGVIREMPAISLDGCPHVGEWARAFDNVSHPELPASIITRARDTYLELCDSQTNVRLLHGDLQHYNILFDDARGWKAIDPKGVM